MCLHNLLLLSSDGNDMRLLLTGPHRRTTRQPSTPQLPAGLQCQHAVGSGQDWSGEATDSVSGLRYSPPRWRHPDVPCVLRKSAVHLHPHAVRRQLVSPLHTGLVISPRMGSLGHLLLISGSRSSDFGKEFISSSRRQGATRRLSASRLPCRPAPAPLSPAFTACPRMDRRLATELVAPPLSCSVCMNLLLY